MKLFPRATKKQVELHWNLRYEFLQKVKNLANTEETVSVQMEDVEAVLLAAEKVLAQMEREKKKQGKVGRELYLSGLWTCPDIFPDKQRILWENFRNALEIIPGTATATAFHVGMAPLEREKRRK